MRQNKEAQSHNGVLYDSLTNYSFFFQIVGWLGIHLLPSHAG